MDAFYDFQTLAKQSTEARTYGYEEILKYVRDLAEKTQWEIGAGADAHTQESYEQKVKTFIREQIDLFHFSVPNTNTHQLMLRLYNDMERFSVLTPYIDDAEVRIIRVDSWESIHIETMDGQPKIVNEKFNSPLHAQEIIARLVQQTAEVVIDARHPVVEIETDISKTNEELTIFAAVPPVVDCAAGVVCHIGKPRQTVATTKEYVAAGFASQKMLDFLTLAAQHGMSILLAGESHSAKEGLADYLLDSFPDTACAIAFEKGTQKTRSRRKNIIHLSKYEQGDGSGDATTRKTIWLIGKLNPNIVFVKEAAAAERTIAIETSLAGHTTITGVTAGNPRQAYYQLAAHRKSECDEKWQMALREACMAFPIVVWIHAAKDHVSRIMNISVCLGDEASYTCKTLWEYHPESSFMSPDGLRITGEFVTASPYTPRLVNQLKLWGATEHELDELYKNE